MTSGVQSPRQTVARRSWIAWIFVVAAGVAAGFYLAGPASGPATEPHVAGESSATALGGSSPEGPSSAATALPSKPERVSPAAKLHRFTLSAADAKDTQGAPDIAVDDHGQVHITWASITGESEQTCFLASSTEGLDGFSTPRAVVRSPIAYRPSGGGKTGSGKKGFPIRMAPHVVARGNAVNLAWTETVPDETTVRMMLVETTRGQEAWPEPRCVHEHAHARPTFTALAIGAQGELACCWLDGRASTQHPYASLCLPGRAEFLPELKVPGGENGKGVCPCCPTNVTFAPDGTLFVAFRNLVDGYRDLAIARLRPGEAEFEGPFPIVPPAWKFDGCPHDGPSLVVAEGQLHATWMDAHTGVQRVYYGRASLDELEFDVQPLHAQGPGTQGNAKLFADSQGVHAVWEESFEDEPTDTKRRHQHGPPIGGRGRSVCYALAPPGGAAFESMRRVNPIAGTYQTRPASAGDRQGQIHVAWCELDQERKSIVVTTVGAKGQATVAQGTPQ